MLGRNGWDGAGAPIDMVLHVPSSDNRPETTATWNPFGGRYDLMLGDGNPVRSSASDPQDDDVVAHEIGHGVWFSSVAPAGIDRQPPARHFALSEAFADLFAASVDEGDWTIGEATVRAGHLRDLAHPRWTHMGQVPASGGEQHDVSGVPALAGVRMAEAWGRDAAMSVWLRAASAGMSLAGEFPMFAAATVAAARERLGEEAAAQARAPWRSVGIAPSRPAAGSELARARPADGRS